MADPVNSATDVPEQNPASAEAPSKASRARAALGRLSFLNRIWDPFGVIADMWVALLGPDAPSRKMAFVFFGALAVFAVVAKQGYHRIAGLEQLKSLAQTQAFEDTSKNLGEFIHKQAETARHKFSTLPLGRFSVEISTEVGAKGSTPRLQLAELEMVVECDNKETRYFIEDNMAKVRDQITSALIPVDREELLTPEGKKQLKKRILDRVNSWLPEGRIVELFFSDLILN